MPGRVTMRIAGLAETNRNLLALGPKAGKAAMRRVARKALAPMRDEAQRRAPRQTGGLAESFVVSTVLTKRQRRMIRREGKDAVTVYLGSSHPAAVPQEFGTWFHPAQPTLRPVWDGGKDALLQFIIRELDREIVKTAGRIAAKAAKG